MLNLIESCFQLITKWIVWDFISARFLGCPPPALRFLPSAPSRHWRCSSSLSAEKIFKPKILSIVLCQKKIPNWNEFPCFAFFLLKSTTFPGLFVLKLTNTTPLPVPAHQPGPPAARMACRKDLPGKGSGVQPPNDNHKAQRGSQEPTRSNGDEMSFHLLPKVLSSRQWEFKGLWSPTEFWKNVERHVERTFQSIQNWVPHWDCGAPLEMSIASCKLKQDI